MSGPIEVGVIEEQLEAHEKRLWRSIDDARNLLGRKETEASDGTQNGDVAFGDAKSGRDFGTREPLQRRGGMRRHSLIVRRAG